MFSTNKKGVFIILGLLSLSSIAFVVYKYQTNKSIVTSTPTINAIGTDYKGLLPGKSTEEEIVNTLGIPIKESTTDNAKILEYKSKNPNYNNTFYTQQGILNLAKEIITPDDNIKISNIAEQYGNYEEVLYKSGSEVGFNLYIYPDKGIAYIGHQPSGIVIEVWYFPPTDFENFKKMYAPDMPDQPIPKYY